MTTIKLPPPRRFVVSDDDNGIPYLVEVTGIEDPVYIVGLESPWHGVSLEDIEKYMKEGAYGSNTWNLKAQIIRASGGETFFETEEE